MNECTLNTCPTEHLEEDERRKYFNIDVIGFIFEKISDYYKISKVKWIKYQKDEMKNIYYI